MGADGVVDDAEMVNFHVKGVAVGDVSAEEVLVFEGAEEAFDGAVGLGGFDWVRTWRSRGSLLAKAVWKVCPRKQGPLSETTAMGAGRWSMTVSAASTTSITPRSARRSSKDDRELVLGRDAPTQFGEAGMSCGTRFRRQLPVRAVRVLVDRFRAGGQYRVFGRTDRRVHSYATRTSKFFRWECYSAQDISFAC